MFKNHIFCRACGGAKMIPVFDLGNQPLANNFTTPLEESAGCAPLKVLFCPECTLSQLDVVVKPEILYANYNYITSQSQTMRDHFKVLWSSIKLECNPKSVVEIGSNDGGFLEFALANGATDVVGIDAAKNLVDIANQRKIPTVLGVFNDYTADCARRKIEKPDVIIARHVFCHADDWVKFMLNLDILSCHKTLIVIEVPYVMDTLRRVEFDQFYHEHLSYLSLRAMERLLVDTPFQIHKVERFTIHGGSIAIFLRRRDFGVTPDPSVADAVANETITPETWRVFSGLANARIKRLRTTVNNLVESGSRIAGFGASAKSTVWINACKFRRRQVEFICDNTPQKQGKLSPGNDIPIVPESHLLECQPDYAILFAWNFRNEIVGNNQPYLERGGKFIVPGQGLDIVAGVLANPVITK